ncbi:MAG: AAA family ATPase, partial [Campylobacterales bacterium]|nr:AAA family ATPase [Campylobacterales bacterium]
SSIFITLEKGIDRFLKINKNNNIKPLFLKKIEDVDLLLNVLENDLKAKEVQINEQKEIATIDTITVQNFFSINNIELHNLKNKKEIYIVGENGDGKTLLLQSIAVGLKGVNEDGLQAFREKKEEFNLEIITSDGLKYDSKGKHYNNLIAYGSSRNNSCNMKIDQNGYLTLFQSHFDLYNPIKWLQYLDYSQKADKSTVISLEDAKALIAHLLNREIEINIVPSMVADDGVEFREKGVAVTFNQLSAGYRSVIILICDLITRLSEKQQVDDIAQFQGIVLIDEIELHLHPKWQYGFMRKLRETFPLIQFIVTTHSPTILLGSTIEAVYYQVYKEEGVVKISSQKEVNNSFLNDIQSTIFGFDVNEERIHNPSKDDKKRQDRAKKNLLNLIDSIKEEQ